MKINRWIRALNQNVKLKYHVKYHVLPVIFIVVFFIGLYLMLFTHVSYATAMILLIFGAVGFYLVECD